MTRLLGLAGLIALAACYSPPSGGNCDVRCAAGSEACPEGLACFGGYCQRPGDQTTCGPDDAAPPDGPGAGASLSGLALGYGHTCGIDADARLWCWGDNYTMQLGVDYVADMPYHAEAVEVTAAGVTGWREVAAGREFTCAIADPDGEMYCWGHDSHGQLGRDSQDTPFGSPEPVDDSGLGGTGWDRVVVGDAHVCGLRGGALHCWGTNEQQQLGTGPGPNQDLPARIGADADWVELAAEGANTCGIRSSGGTERHLYCWGLPIALGVDPPAADPYGLPDLEIEHPNHDVGRRFQTVAMGAGFACAIDDAADLHCWGYNDLLQQGDPSGGYAPSLIDSLRDWTAVVAEGSHACGLAGAALYCWGGSPFGEAGVRADQVELDQPIAGSWREVAIGPDHTCAVSTAGEAFCWGDNGSAQLGLGAIGDGLVPRQVQPGSTWAKVAAGWHSTCAIAASDGAVWCWGLDEEGTLGTAGDSATPRPVPGLGTGFTELALHLQHGCAIDGDDSALWCWGDGGEGELGTGADMGSDATRVGSSTWRSVGVADHATCAIHTDGTLWCWGSRYQGALGDGSETGNATTPQQITTTGDEWDRIAMGPTHACARRQDGSAACWGWNAFNAVDESATEVISAPDPIGAPAAGWTQLSTGGEYYTHTCGLVGDAAYCWGSGIGGRLGVGDFEPHTAPTQITQPAATGWESISAGGPHSCGLRDGGKLFCWGDALVTPLGNGRVAGSSAPVQVGSADGWKQVDAGIYHVCAIDSADALWCWGDDSQLQLGSGVGMTPAPQAVTAVP